MTNERARSELEQLYMSLSEEKKKALDVAFKSMEQADGEYIPKQAVLENIDQWYEDKADIEDLIVKITYIQGVAIPSAEPKTGHWISMYTEKQSHIKDGMVTESVKCSECDEWLTASDEYDCYGRYCPNCGCRMVEPQESEE